MPVNKRDSLWAMRRRAILLAADAVESQSADDWAAADALLFEARSTRPLGDNTYQREDAPQRIQKLVTSEPQKTWQLPFDELNACLMGGLRPGATCVIAGERGHGKSILIDQILEDFSMQGASTHLLLSEMSVADRDSRWIQRRTAIAEERVLAGDLSEGEVERVVAEAETFPWTASEVAGASFGDIADLMIEHPSDVFALDLLSRVPARDHRELEAGFSRLVDAARMTGALLLVGHHFNEKGVDDSGVRLRRPTLANLRGSGSIANFSDAVMIVARDHDPDDGARLLSSAEIWLAKVRAGRPGGCKVRLNSTQIRFDPVAA